MPSLKRHRLRFGMLLATAAAAIPAVALWHFTVDDALISARYADHRATGVGYRFNRGGPVTDGVTPLGWAYVCAAWAGHGPLAALRITKLVGVGCWLLAAAALGQAIAWTTRRPLAWLSLLLVLCSAPLGAWSAAGMETGLVLGVATMAVVARAAGSQIPRGALAASCAGVVAALRPECLPWAVAFALAPGRPSTVAPEAEAASTGVAWAPDWLRRKLGLLAWTIGPFVVVALIRQLAFGRAAPLSLLAKPSDFAHGWRYALAGALLAGPIAVLAWRGVEAWCRGLQISILVHLAAVAVAGGDWMPLSRLLVPVLPAVVLLTAQLLDRPAPFGTLGRLIAAFGGRGERAAAFTGQALTLGRLALALGGEIFVWVKVGPAAARVGLDRVAVIDELRGPLAEAHVVATLDVGWVGAATEADLVDLAGVTDPAVAALPGGHTSKWVTPELLSARRVDTLVLLLGRGQTLAAPWTDSAFARVVELRVADMPAMASEFVPVAQSRNPRLPYVVLRRRATR
jgi:hypothetical protein